LHSTHSTHSTLSMHTTHTTRSMRSTHSTRSTHSMNWLRGGWSHCPHQLYCDISSWGQPSLANLVLELRELQLCTIDPVQLCPNVRLRSPGASRLHCPHQPQLINYDRVCDVSHFVIANELTLVRAMKTASAWTSSSYSWAQLNRAPGTHV
jgi:hypothetical protein